MNKLKLPLLLFILLFIASCGSRKKTTTLPAEDAAVAAVVANHYANEADFNTLQGRLRVQYQSEERTQAVTVSFRMKKNDTIWMSGQLLGIPLARVLITQERVMFYEKISGQYFDGDFSLLSDLLGTPLDFEKVQNLLLGQTIYDLREERYKLTESGQGYQLVPETAGFIKKLFLLDAGHYKTKAQQIAQESAMRSATVTYPEYQRVQGQVLPKEIRIIASEGTTNTQIDMQFRSVELNVPVSFPFSIPSGYDEIIIE